MEIRGPVGAASNRNFIQFPEGGRLGTAPREVKGPGPGWGPRRQFMRAAGNAPGPGLGRSRREAGERIDGQRRVSIFMRMRKHQTKAVALLNILVASSSGSGRDS